LGKTFDKDIIDMPSNSENPQVKLATVAKSAAKPGAKPTKTVSAAPKISIVSASEDNFGPVAPTTDKAEILKLKQLLAAVVEKTSAKKKDAKEIVDATLAEIAAALGKGHSLSLPPLGNLRVVKSQEKGGATTMVLRLRVGGGKDTGEDGVADPSDDS
jgi:hypothetical protein